MTPSYHEIHSAMTGHRAKAPPASAVSRLPELVQAVRLLVDARGGAEILRVSLRQFHNLRDSLPSPVILGERCVRWRVADLAAHVAGLSASEKLPEPAQLRAGKSKKAACGDARGDHTMPVSETHAGRAVGIPAAPSNSKMPAVTT